MLGLCRRHRRKAVSRMCPSSDSVGRHGPLSGESRRRAPEIPGRLASIFLNAAFPRRCRECGVLYAADVRAATPASSAGGLEAVFSAALAGYFCTPCRQVAWVRSPMCTQCGLPFVSDQGVDHLCGHCAEAVINFDAARAAAMYQHCLRTLIHDFKYRGREYLAESLGRLLWAALIKHWDPDDFDTILPVPLHWRRLYRRGFNQAALLMRCWPRAASEAGMLFDHGKIARRLLIRQHRTASQTGLNRRQRKSNLRRAFTLGDRQAEVRGRRILIVDDVFTTGATVDACGRVLKRAGAISVKVLTLARAG